MEFSDILPVFILQGVVGGTSEYARHVGRDRSKCTYVVTMSSWSESGKDWMDKVMVPSTLMRNTRKLADETMRKMLDCVSLVDSRVLEGRINRRSREGQAGSGPRECATELDDRGAVGRSVESTSIGAD